MKKILFSHCQRCKSRLRVQDTQVLNGFAAIRLTVLKGIGSEFNNSDTYERPSEG